MISMEKIKKNIKSLSVTITYKCNAKCRHCQTVSPPVPDTLDPGLFSIALDALAWGSNLNYVSIWGGEPMLFPDCVFKCISSCRKKSLKTSIVTNGFWGKCPVSAAKTAQTLKKSGLDEIVFSIDAFHQEWIDIQSVKNAVQACRKSGINSILWAAKYLSGPDSQVPEDIATRELTSRIEEEYNIKSSFFTSPVFMFGRAEKDSYIKKYARKIEIADKLEEVTDSDLSRINIEPDGFLSVNNRLVIGPIKELLSVQK